MASNTTKSDKSDKIIETEAKPESSSLTGDLKYSQMRSKNLSLVILLAFVFGVAGNLIGDLYVTPFYNKIHNQTNKATQTTGEVQNIQVNEQSAVVDVVKRASPAVVSIIISKDLNKLPDYSSSPFSFDPFFQSRNSQSQEPNIQEIGGGSGFIITDDGLIATNKHVVDDPEASYTVLTNDGKRYEAKVLSRDPVNDLALVKIEATGLPTLSLGDSTDLEIGQRVIAIGNSLGQYQNTVTTGIVSGIGRTITASGTSGSEQLEGVIQTDAAINPGNSGGPLLDVGGSVIGLNTAIDSEGQLLGFALPVADLKSDLDSFKKFGSIVKPFLGVRYVLVNQAIKDEKKLTVDYGALVIGGGTASTPAVQPNSAAAKAGIKENDIILEVNGKKIDQDHSLAGMLKNYNPNDVVKMKILSGGTEKEVAVTLGESK